MASFTPAFKGPVLGSPCDNLNGGKATSKGSYSVRFIEYIYSRWPAEKRCGLKSAASPNRSAVLLCRTEYGCFCKP